MDLHGDVRTYHVNSIEVQEMRLNGGPPASIFEGCLQRNHHLGRVRPGLGMERKERKIKTKN